MSSVIRILDEQTINQIAAGEVIENPSSVVKELVENAIDAGSTEVAVEIKGGGRQLIRVTDDGCGMSADDALLALERHATSKIRVSDDLAMIGTMGFRGEAIPSIASISKWSLLTRQAKEEQGTLVLVEGGKMLQVTSAARSPGTTIEVKSLFYNVPVRKKFQRSPTYDANEIHKVMTLFALAHPTIKFQLIHNQQIVLVTHAPQGETFSEQLEERITSVLGGDSYYNMCPLYINEGEVKVEGFIGDPGSTRQNRSGQYLFVNHRAVWNHLVSRAVKEGYGTTIPTHRFPLFVLHLSLPGDLVDVNVHPQKREVRFRRAGVLRDVIFKGVDQALQKGGISFHEEITLPNTQALPGNPWSHPPLYTEMKLDPFPEPEATFVVKETEQQLFTVEESEKGEAQSQRPEVLATMKRFVLLDPHSVKGMSPEGICLLDQQAAHARVIFERWSQQEGGPTDVQELLIPFTFEVSAVETALLTAALDELQQLGIQIEEFGHQTFVVHALPSSFGDADIQVFVMDLVHQLHEQPGKTNADVERFRMLAGIASRAAISKKTKLSLEEAERLVAELMRCKNPWQCPIGKPAMTLLTPEFLAKQMHE